MSPIKEDKIMAETTNIIFLCRRMKELREKNNCSQDDMAKKLQFANKSTISRIESGKVSYKNLLEFARAYCIAFGLSEQQIEKFLRGDKIAIPDTSALLKNPQLIDELNKEYSKVVIPKIVVDELDHIKDRGDSTSMRKKAWEIIRGIGYNDRTISMSYIGEDKTVNNDCKIISIAHEVVKQYGCNVDIITDDADYSAYLKGDESVKALHLREYMFTKQDLVDMTTLAKVRDYYADNYNDLSVPEDVNAYLPDGNTLLISIIRNRQPSFEQKKAKIEWLLLHGADINKRDCSRRFFPPLSHAVQMGDIKMFTFLLKECGANPNIGSRNPHDSGKVRQKNEGNMPLMIAAWEGKDWFVKALCDDERTSINQQDANGFTALIKAAYWGCTKCMDILKKAGADQKIVDIDGLTADDHYKIFLESDRESRNKGEKKSRW